MKFVRLGALVCIAGFLVMMLGPFQGAESSFGLTDKTAHAAAFATITAALFLAAPGASRVQVAAIALCVGAAVECVQYMTGRDAEFADFLADGLGIVVVSFLWWRNRWF